jgi:hypothetical protein
MSDLTLDPYMMKVVSDFLRSNLDGIRVVSDPPPEDRRTEAWVEVVQLNVASNTSDPADRVKEYLMQFNCYAGAEGGKPEAERLSRTVYALLRTDFPGEVYDAPTDEDDDVAVSYVSRGTGPMSMPDSDGFEPSRDRFVLDAVIYAYTIT